MKLLIQPKALKSLEKISFYVDSIHTKGSGERFLTTFLSTVKQYAQKNLTYQPCKHSSLSAKGYSCIFHEKWVVAFKIKGDRFIIYRIIWGPALH